MSRCSGMADTLQNFVARQSMAASQALWDVAAAAERLRRWPTHACRPGAINNKKLSSCVYPTKNFYLNTRQPRDDEATLQILFVF